MNKKTSIIGAAMAAVMFGAIAVGSTLALYTSEKTINVHLYAGKLSAGLYLTEIVRDEIDSEGHWEADQEVDLSGYEGYDEEKGVDLSVFSGAVFSDIKLVPGMTGTATFRLYNTGDIAFNYSVTMVNFEGDAEFEDDLLITYPTSTAEVKKDSYVDFTVSYEFRDDGLTAEGVGANNDAMNEEVSFDLSVLCVQVAKE